MHNPFLVPASGVVDYQYVIVMNVVILYNVAHLIILMLTHVLFKHAIILVLLLIHTMIQPMIIYVINRIVFHLIQKIFNWNDIV